MILLLGATGYIGQAFAAELGRRSLAFVPLTRSTVDYTRFHVLFHYVRTTRPGFIINAAGYPGRPDLDDCEVHRAEAVQANTLLPQTVARVGYLAKTPWGHVSSGGIYSGAKVAQNGRVRIERDLNRPEVRRLFDTDPGCFQGFVEADEPNSSFRSPPCSFYSGTKALAEEALRWFDQGYIWRPHLVFDECDHPQNFLAKILNGPGICDGVNSLTHRGDFVRACLDLWERRAPFGTYHVVNPGAVTERHLIEAAQRVLQRQRPLVSLKNDQAARASEVKAPRSHCLLDIPRLLAAGVKMRPVHEAINESLERWKSIS